MLTLVTFNKFTKNRKLFFCRYICKIVQNCIPKNLQCSQGIASIAINYVLTEEIIFCMQNFDKFAMQIYQNFAS